MTRTPSASPFGQDLQHPGRQVADALREGAKRLAAVSDTARLDAELLMAHALGVSRSGMLVRHMETSAPSQFDDLIERRAGHEPVAYITGAAGFYGREFRVTPDVLIPRADSETLIDAALEVTGRTTPRVLDLGTGSGALLLTMLAELPDARGVGIDASAGAVAIARSNAEELGLAERTDILQRDWHVAGWQAGLGRFDLVLCNPPYVEMDAALDRQVRDYEPASALFAGPDGLDEHRALVPQLRALMVDGAVALLEIGASQGAAIAELAQASQIACKIRRDLANWQRCAVLAA